MMFQHVPDMHVNQDSDCQSSRRGITGYRDI